MVKYLRKESTGLDTTENPAVLPTTLLSVLNEMRTEAEPDPSLFIKKICYRNQPLFPQWNSENVPSCSLNGGTILTLETKGMVIKRRTLMGTSLNQIL